MRRETQILLAKHLTAPSTRLKLRSLTPRQDQISPVGPAAVGVLVHKEAVVRKLALFLAALASITGLLTLTASAGPEDSVSATVTAVVISVNVSPNSISYGPQPVGTTNAVPSPMPLDVLNDGTVAENFQIKGSNTADWSLASTAGTNQYVHIFSTDGPTGTYKALTTTNQALYSGSVAPAGVVNVDLRMDLPTLTAATTQQTATVTVLATQAP